MIMQPDSVTQEIVEKALKVVAFNKDAPSALNRVKFQTIEEGKCAQILHLGPFSEEGPVIERLHAAIKSTGLNLTGKHHEIYLSDMRRVPPEKYRTVLRQPVG